MKSLKTKIAIIFLFLEIFCFAKEFHISLEPIFGVQHGTLYELVYEADSKGETYKLSELDWDNTLLYLGGKITFSYRIFDFFLEAGGFFPIQTGKMADSDWMYAKDHSMKTHFSLSDNYLDYGGFFSTGSCAIFPIIENIKLSPRLFVDFQYKKFYDDNLRLWYGSGSAGIPWNDESVVCKERNTIGIEYERADFNIWTGLCAQFWLFNFICLDSAFDVAIFSLVDSLDSHLLKSTYFYDCPNGFFSYGKISADSTFLINKYFSVKANASYTFPFKELRGDTYYTYNKESSFIKQKAESGASLALWNWAVSVIWNVF